MRLNIGAALVAAFYLAGCASLCDPNDKQCQHEAKEDAADVGAGIGAALDILDAFAPPTTTTTTTKTCTKDRRGEETCNSITQGN